MSSQIDLLKSKRFLPFFITQFLGAFNDNLYKNAIIVLIVFKLALENSSVWVNLAAALFVLPFFLFSSIAGQLADKYDKALVMKTCKFFEIPIMALGAYGFYLQNPTILLVTLCLTGIQSSFFGPAKYGILPQHLKENELIGGNGLVEMGTFVAILIGTMCGAYFVNLTNSEVMVSSFIVGAAIVGYMSSLFIPKAPSSNSELKVNLNLITGNKNLFNILKSQKKSVLLSVVGISWFWFIGAVYLTQIPAFAKEIHGDETVVTLILAFFSIGIAVGSLLCEKLSRGHIELGIVPLGSIGLSLFGFLLCGSAESFTLLPAELMENPSLAFTDILMSFSGLYLLCSIFMIGFFGGVYTVPLYAIIQERSEAKYRSRIIASNNVMNSIFMVVSAVFAMIALSLDLTVSDLFFVMAIMNIVVAAYIFNRLPEFFIRFVAWIISHTIYRVKHTNIDNLTKEGGVVIVSNHVSFMDAIIIAGAFKRPVHYVMYEPIYKIPVLNKFFKAMGAIPINSKSANPKVFNEAFDLIQGYLEKGEVVCIFPEGKLTSDGSVDTFKSGIEKIVERSQSPVLPCALQGLWGSMFSRKNKFRLPRMKWSKIHVNVGEMIQPEDVTKDSLREIVINLRRGIK